MAFTERYVDGDIGNDSYDGTSPTVVGGSVGPWKSLFGSSGAATKQTAGMRINIKEVSSGYNIDLFGMRGFAPSGITPGTVSNPIVWRGYTTIPGDGGKATIKPVAGTQPGITFATNPGVWYAQNLHIYANTSGYGHLITLNDATPTFMNCIFRNTYSGGNVSYGQIFSTGNWIRAYSCTMQIAGTGADHKIAELVRLQMVGCFLITPRNGIKTGTQNTSFFNNVIVANSSESKSNSCYGVYFNNADIVRVFCNNVIANFYNGVYFYAPNDSYMNGNLFVDNTNAIYNATAYTSDILPMFCNKMIGTGNLIAGEGYPELQSDILNTFETLTGTPLLDKAGYDFRPAISADGTNVFEAGFPAKIGAGYTTYDGYDSLLSAGPYAGHDWPAAGDVRESTTCRHSKVTGTLVLPDAGDVRDGTVYDATTEGTLDLPAVTDVRDGVLFDGESQEGILDLPLESTVQSGVQYDNTTKTGTYAPSSGTVPRDLTFEDNSDVVS